MALTLALCVVASSTEPSRASAFCGFYVGGAGSTRYANATMVVMMREGIRTVLSMQNDYEGPLEEFAMVVPVPAVLHEGDVRTLPRDLFARVDTLTAPRLVEYWEQDPCESGYRGGYAAGGGGGGSIDDLLEGALSVGGRRHVRVEARFAVDEYDVVILSADDSSALEDWLHEHRYAIPRGARALLRPYVEQGMKFFVARVDPARVRFVGGRAVLSPLRVHYDSPDFWLPVRLGLLSSPGTQDLVLHVISPGGRYEVANYDNVTVPTNLTVDATVRADFGAFYEALFQSTVYRHPRAVVTEYAWGAGSCDPCPGPALDPSDLSTLGADVIDADRYRGFTITRLHYRYGPNDLTEDLVLRRAPPIFGGRGEPAADGSLNATVSVSAGHESAFQGRYAILHEWEGPIECAHPRRGIWGGPRRGRASVQAGGQRAMESGRARPRQAPAMRRAVRAARWRAAQWRARRAESELTGDVRDRRRRRPMPRARP